MVLSWPPTTSPHTRLTNCASGTPPSASAAVTMPLTRSSPGVRRRSARSPAPNALNSSIAAATCSLSWVPSEKACSLQCRIRSHAESSRPMSRLITAAGNGRANSATKSTGCRLASSRSRSSSTVAAIQGRHRATALGVNARRRVRRSRRWSGPSWLNMRSGSLTRSGTSERAGAPTAYSRARPKRGSESTWRTSAYRLTSQAGAPPGSSAGRGGPGSSKRRRCSGSWAGAVGSTVVNVPPRR